MTVTELIHALSAEGVAPGAVVRHWCGDVDCVATEVSIYREDDGEERVDLDFVNRAQENGSGWQGSRGEKHDS